MYLYLWWHFQFGWTRTNQEVFTCLRGFTCFSRLTGMAPAQAMTRTFVWLKKEAAAAASGFFPRLGFAGYEPKCSGAWTVEGGSCVMRQLMNGWIA